MLNGRIVLIFKMDKNHNQNFQKFWNLTGWIYRYVNLRCCENFQSEQQEQTSPSVCISLFELFHLSVRSIDCLYFCFESSLVFVDFHQYEIRAPLGESFSSAAVLLTEAYAESLWETEAYAEPLLHWAGPRAIEASLWDFSGKIICKAHPWKRNPDVDTHTILLEWTNSGCA